jgi:tetratricopeptide (TPR) repeat protein
MRAIVSGVAGIVLLIDREQMRAIHRDDADTDILWTPSDLHFHLAGVSDLRVYEDIDREAALVHLLEAIREEDALQVSLLLLDPEIPVDIREQATLDLEELIDVPEVDRFMKCLFAARQLPEKSDIESALGCCERADAQRTLSFLNGVKEDQPAVAMVRAAWDSASTRSLGSDDDRKRAEHTAFREGLFRDLVACAKAEEVTDLWELQALATFHQEELGNYRDLTAAWVAPFKRTRIGAGFPSLTEESEGEDGDTEISRGGKKRRLRFDREEAFESVQSQKEAIVRAMVQRKFSLISRYVKDLADYQIATDSREHAAKSLCDLAMNAKEMGFLNLQYEWTRHAVEIQPTDGWAWAQYGDALVSRERFDEATVAYVRAGNFGEFAISKKGIAQVLKQTGRFAQSLEAFDQVIGESPEDIYAKNGRAETLKVMGRQQEALDAYEEVIRDHPEDVVAKSGRAEVLKSMGCLQEALDAYEGVIRDQPEEVVAKNGRAEVLKSMGCLQEALDAYEGIIRDHPEDVVAKTGRAEVFRAMGRFQESLNAYELVIRDHPENAVAKTGHAEVFKVMGCFQESLDAYELVIHDRPESVVAKTGRAEVLKVMGCLQEALGAYEDIMRDHPQDAVARNGKAAVLALVGNWNAALDLLPVSPPMTREDWIGYHIRGMTLLRMGRTDEAIQVFQEGVDQDPWATSRDYYRTALSMALIQKRRNEEAIGVLNEITAIEMEGPKNVILLHAYGMMKDHARACDIYPRVDQSAKVPFVIPLKEELRRRYVEQLSPQQSDEWVFNKEVEYLLAA